MTEKVLVLALAVLMLVHGQSWVYGRSNSLCYSDGKAYRCIPTFSNVLEHLLPAEAASARLSTCGASKKQRLCRGRGNCHSCMRDTHGARYLTDPHVNSNTTYWASSLVRAGDSVTLTYDLGKLFEIYYISLIFIPLLEPDSVVIEKSLDGGDSWSVWHYFSKDCQRSFGLAPTETAAAAGPDGSESRRGASSGSADSAITEEVRCSPLARSRTAAAAGNLVVAFTTSTNSLVYLQQSGRFLNWMSATNIRVSLKKFKTSEYHLGFTYPPILKQYFGQLEQKRDSSSNDSQHNLLNDQAVLEAPSVLNAYEYFAVADISVGGRCQCYGHSGQCMRDAQHKFQCDCQHHTEGRDCEACKTGYQDKPWSPASLVSANECKRCNCNLHSKSCSFDKNLFILSNRQSGGSCQQCQHNTAGRYCHICAKGYYRDWTKPLSHQFVCLKCRCHPIGSKSAVDCDQRNSQCVCKPGVTGLSCNRCMKGYQQTRSPIHPCVKNYDPHKIPMAQAPDDNCHQCNSKRKRIRFKKYCRKDAVLLVTMQSREQHNDMIRFEMKINHVWRINAHKFQRMQPDFLAAVNAGRNVDRNSNMAQNDEQQTRTSDTIGNQQQYHSSTFALWLRESDLKCGCPSLQLGASYLLILKLNTIRYLGRSELLLDQKSVALLWQKSWIRRLQKFSARHLQGHCEKFKRKRYRRHQKRGGASTRSSSSRTSNNG